MRRLLFFRHGILINRWLLEPMARSFRRRGWEVHNRSYSTTRKRIEEHAEDLRDEIAAALAQAGGPESAEVYCLTHSLGGLVLRHALNHLPGMPRVRRAVMLVPPNQGSQKARYYRDDPLFRKLYGARAGAQLAEDPATGVFSRLGVPCGVEIGIIAGVATPPQLFASPLEKPHDGVVALAETALGDFPVRKLRVTHTGLLFVPRVWREAASFLETGAFSDEIRAPAAGS